jgi:hypothetical protein
MAEEAASCLREEGEERSFHMVFPRPSKFYILAINHWIADVSEHYNKFNHFSPIAVWIYSTAFPYLNGFLPLQGVRK